MMSKKTMPKLSVLATYSIFATIVSTILSNSIQLYTLSLPDVLQVYLYVYLFLFLPLLIVMLIVAVQPQIESRLIIILCALSLLITFALMTSVSIFIVDTSNINLFARFTSLFKFLPVIILEQDNFGAFVLIVNIIEMLIFLYLAFLYTNNVKKS